MKAMTLRMDDELMEQVDQERGIAPREPFVRVLIMEALAARQAPLVPAQPVVEVLPRPVTGPVQPGKPFDKDCAKKQYHFTYKVCRFCGGDR